MSKKTAKPTRSDNPVGTRVLVLFGLDENKKPRAARFTGDELGLLAKAAESMNLTVCDVNSPQLTEIAEKLPAGRLYASGRGFVPHVTKEVYGKLVEAAGSNASADPPTPLPAQGLPRNFDEIEPGHLVIAQETLDRFSCNAPDRIRIAEKGLVAGQLFGDSAET